MIDNILFSIVIPTYNRADLLRRCLDSIEAQTYRNWEAIVVDNFSEDNTEDVIKSFNDERIIYIKNHNYGVIAVSRNKALDVAKGDWVAFLDSDDCWYPNKLEYVLPYLNDYDLVYHGYMENIPKTRLLQRRKRYFYEIKENTVPYVLMRGDPINPSCTCVSRKAIGNTRFSEDKVLTAVEDYDFFLQLLAKGIKTKYLKAILTLYDMSGCSHSAEAGDRDALIHKKWEEYLNDEEKKEVYIQYLTRVVPFLMEDERFDEARGIYKQILRSKLYYKKKFAIKGLIKCTLKIKSIF